jgi:flagellar biosynthetic protein FliP
MGSEGLRRRLTPLWAGVALAPLLLGPAVPAAAAGLPGLGLGPGAAAPGPQSVALGVQILLALTALSMAPAILLLMTSFTRIVIVLSFARSALATGQIPPNQVIVGLALFLTLFVMGPTFQQVYRQAWVPYRAGRLNLTQALTAAEQPLGRFMLAQTRTSDLQLFSGLAQREQALAAGKPAPAAAAPAPAYGPQHLPPLTVLVPAFVLSELRTAFEMGFLLFIPFVIIDLVVGSTLMATGMMMLPPMLVSLPFKILLFVLVDGWTLLVQSLVLSFR